MTRKRSPIRAPAAAKTLAVSLALLGSLAFLPPSPVAHAAPPPAADGPGGLAAVKSWAKRHVREGMEAFEASGGRRYGSPFFWGDEAVYQIQVDRFNDGDPSNNDDDIEEWQRRNQGGNQAGLENYKHGGDLEGVIERLDYIKGLGASTIWLTPVFKGNGSYHGYCTSDLTRLDPTFGDLATLQRLTREAHARGLRVVLDVVVNHMCDSRTRYDDAATPFQSWAYGRCVDDHEAKLWSGTGRVRGQRKLSFSDTFFPPFRMQEFFSRCGHKSGDFSGQGNGAVYGDFSSAMFDLDTQNWDFQDLFTELHKYWIAAADVDGFRVDAAKHVTPDFLAAFSTGIRSFAASIGKENFLLVGEVAASTRDQAMRTGKMRLNPWDPYDRSTTTPEAVRSRLADIKDTYLRHPRFPFPGLNATYDFAHSGQAVEMWRRDASPRQVKNWFYAGGEVDNSTCAEEYCEIKGNTDARLSWNLIEIHDWPRFALHGESASQLTGAVQYLLSTKGTPVLYYGVEQGLNGDCQWDSARVTDVGVRRALLEGVCEDASHGNHARFRQDMFLSGPWRLGSVVGSIDRLAGIGWRADRPVSAEVDPYLDTSHDLYRSVRKALAVRRSCEALRRGEIYFRAAHAGGGGGLLAFSRIEGGREALVVANTSGRAIPVKALVVDSALHAGRPFARWKNLYNGFEYGTVGKYGDATALFLAKTNPASGATEELTIAPNGVSIFVDEANVTGWDAGLGAHLCRE